MTITATNARKNIYQLIAQVNESCSRRQPTTKEKAVLVGEDDWAAIEETLTSWGYPA